jgi:cyclophilin family peptidyl-prolyl cis-trans isomerase
VAKRRQTIKCPVCKIEVKSGRLDSHLQKVHPDYGGPVTPKAKKASRPMKSEMWLAATIAVVVVVAAVGIYYINLPKPEENGETPTTTPPTDNGVYPTQYARLSIGQRGEIVIGLYGNETPVTTDNFIRLVSSSFFTGTIFHRVIKNFMIQGGGYTPDLNAKPVTTSPIKLEISSKLHNLPYYVAMARTSDPNSATTQFFINTADNSKILDPGGTSGPDGYAVFGRVVKGMDIVDAIQNVTVENGNNGDSQPSQPTQAVIPTLIISNCMMLGSQYQ